MQFSFDLISDLHAHTWDQFNWHGQATSQICLVAGDVAKDHKDLEDVLSHLTECYQAVFYIDGNDEHKLNWDGIGSNFDSIESIISRCPGVTYLHDNVVIINGVAIVAANGWWTYNFDPNIDKNQCQAWFVDYCKTNTIVAELVDHLARIDTHYLVESVSKLQTHPDVKEIVVMTHTVPNARLVEHDIEIVGTYRMNTMGNSFMDLVLEADTERKISNWFFGHYHGSVDQIIDGVRYLNNPRGRGDTPWKQSVYHPLRIEVGG
jgi:hypothetical protein